MIGDVRTIEGPVLAYPNGTCPRHKSALVSMNGMPHCLRCAAEAARAEAAPAGINQLEDPGHEAMKSLLSKHIKEELSEPLQAVGPAQRSVAKAASPLAPVTDFKEHLAVAVAHLQKAPMPKSITHFKAVQRAIALLEKITGEI